MQMSTLNKNQILPSTENLTVEKAHIFSRRPPTHPCVKHPLVRMGTVAVAVLNNFWITWEGKKSVPFSRDVLHKLKYRLYSYVTQLIFWSLFGYDTQKNKQITPLLWKRLQDQPSVTFYAFTSNWFELKYTLSFVYTFKNAAKRFQPSICQPFAD